MGAYSSNSVLDCRLNGRQAERLSNRLREGRSKLRRGSATHLCQHKVPSKERQAKETTREQQGNNSQLREDAVESSAGTTRNREEEPLRADVPRVPLGRHGGGRYGGSGGGGFWLLGRDLVGPLS